MKKLNGFFFCTPALFSIKLFKLGFFLKDKVNMMNPHILNNASTAYFKQTQNK